MTTTTEYELADNGTETGIPALRVEDFDRQPTTNARLIATRARLDEWKSARESCHV